MSETPAPTKSKMMKDLRNRLIAEYEAGKPLSDPNYYVIKNKNGAINVRKVKTGKKADIIKKDGTEPAPEQEEEKPTKPSKPKAL